MGKERHRFGPIAHASAWVAYFLLAVAMIGPVACVIWLVQKVVENENAVVTRIVAEANEQKLDEAARLIEQRFGELAQGLNELSPAHGTRFQWQGGVPREASETESAAARAILKSAREALRGAPPEAVEQEGVELLSDPDTMGARLPGGRSVAAMVALLTLDEMPPERAIGEAFQQQVEVLLLDSRVPIPSSQRRQLIQRFSARFDTPVMRKLRESETLLERWHAELSAQGAFPPEVSVGRTDSSFYVANLGQATAWVFSYGEALQTMREIEAMDREAIDIESNGAVALQEDDSATLRRILPAPYSFAVLELTKPLARNDAGMANRQAMLYVWIGTIVLGLSVVSGSAIVLFLRKQESSTRLKNNLVATVSHELKTPVSSIRLLVDTLLDPKKRLTVNQQEYIEMISRENLRLGRLIDNFLSFSRMERNKGSFDLRPVSPVEVVELAEEAFRERFNGQRFKLEKELDPNLPDVKGDPEALATVLDNLLENALKYGDEERRIVLRARAAEGGARFEVEDFGRGVARRDRKRIFERFYQVEQHHNGYSGSVGLGLSIVEFIVSKHEGRIELESELGEGSIFKVTIPYA